MMQRYLGVDIGGRDNTWLATIVCDGDKPPSLERGPELKTLGEIVNSATTGGATAVAIDAQLCLSIADSDAGGFRSSDNELRDLLSKSNSKSNHVNWVASFNFLGAVPIRGRLLARALSRKVEVIETHPRACLYFGFRKELGGEELETSVISYKVTKLRKLDDALPHIRKLWCAWAKEFGIEGMNSGEKLTDGALDAIVCATVAYLSHHNKARLYQLKNQEPGDLGDEPFFVMRPASMG